MRYIRPFDQEYPKYGISGTGRNVYPIPHGPIRACRNGHEQKTLVDSRFTVARFNIVDRCNTPRTDTVGTLLIAPPARFLLAWTGVYNNCILRLTGVHAKWSSADAPTPRAMCVTVSWDSTNDSFDRMG